MCSINGRVADVREHFCGGSNKDFAKVIGKKPNTTSNWTQNGYSVGRGVVSDIVKAFPSVSSDWLLYGKGEMLKNSLPATLSTNEEDYMLVPLYNLDARGGFVGNDIVDAVEYIERHIPFLEARTTDICVPVSGDSMIPVYPPGSIVLLREVEGWREYFGFGNNFMLRLTDGRRILKRVQKSSEDSRNNVLCVSYNASVDDEELPKSMIKQVFKVIRTLTDEGY